MLRLKSLYINIFKTLLILTISIFIAACSDDDGPTGPGGNTAKVSGRISASDGSASILGKTTGAESVEGAVVFLVRVQASGTIDTVSSNSVESDANGKFTLETNLSGTKNLIVVAKKGTSTWRAIVSATVQTGTTVYAPPVNEESSTEADLYIQAVSEGDSDEVSDADLKALVDAQVSAQIKTNTNAKAQFISAVKAKSESIAQASGNSYFGLTSAQIQAMANAQAEAAAKLDHELYMSNDTEGEIEASFRNYEKSVITASTSNNIDASTYAQLARIGLTAYANASTSIQAETRFALIKNYYKRISIILDATMNSEFKAAGASESELNAVTTAGATLHASIKNSTSTNQINDAFVQYRSQIKSQLQVTIESHSSQVDSLDASINSSGGLKAALTSALNAGASTQVILNAYLTFYSSLKTAVETSLSTATSAEVDAASNILILANMN